MERSIESIVAIRNLPLFGHRPMALVVRCLECGISRPTNGVVDAAIGGIGTKGTNGVDSGRFVTIELLRGWIADYLNRPELNRHKRSGERLAVQPT